MEKVWIVAGYTHKDTIMEQVKFCVRYGVFDSRTACDKKCAELNKRSIRPDNYYSMPLHLNRSKIDSNGARTRKKKKVA
ncbi:MAG: hypothetical protein IK117_04610 [Bacteroidales bacterium]|nr:hypothetical protein [Bacteroidales bacterium]